MLLPLRAFMNGSKLVPCSLHLSDTLQKQSNELTRSWCCRRMRPQKLAISSDSAQLKGPRYEWATCASPISFRDLAEGKWGLSLRAQDNAGLISQTRCAYLPIAISGLTGDAAN